MNKDMKTKILFTIIILSALVSSCVRGKEVGRCDLSEAQINVIPYKKGQVISFIDSLGQIIDLTVTKYELAWGKTEYGGSGFHEDYIKTREATVTLELEPNYLINFRLSPYACVNNKGDYCMLSIYLFQFGSQFNFFFDIEGNFLFVTTRYYDSLEINGKVYYDVKETYHNRNDYATSPPYKTMQLFYNKEYGILQILKDGENFLTLKN